MATSGKKYERHGLSAHPIYRIWSQMIQRCHNPQDAKYSLYGGRGIQVCKRWRDSVVLFVIDMGERPEGMSIERCDNDGHYEPSNCRWATAIEQAQNKGRYSNNTTGVTGVSWHSNSGLYYAHIRVNGERIGHYTRSFKSACAWRKAAEAKRATA